MPVKSSDSSVLKWPRKNEVLRALSDWAGSLRSSRQNVIAVGYFGSLAGADWGVGSDVDLLIVVSRSASPPLRRPLEFDLSPIPVAADLLVYTAEEWKQQLERNDRFATEMRRVVWL